MFLDTAQHFRYLRIEVCFTYSLTVKTVLYSLKIENVVFLFKEIILCVCKNLIVCLLL